MLYHAVRAVHRGYALTLFWLYVGLFGVAFCFIFVFPPVTIGLLFLGIFGLVAAYLGGLLLGIAGKSLARSALRRDRCPRCGSVMAVAAPSGGESDRPCQRCGACFDSTGAEIGEHEAADAGEASTR